MLVWPISTGSLGKIMHDCCVIGGGWAGVAAALTLARAGRSVLLVRKHGGATALASGALDLAGSPPSEPGVGQEEPVPLRTAMAAMMAGQPWHPYRILGTPEKAHEVVVASLGIVREALAAVGYRLVGSFEDRVALFNALGTFKPTSLCHETHYEVRLGALERGVVAIFGVRGLSGFRARDFMLRAAAYCQRSIGWKYAELPIGIGHSEANLTNALVAGALEDDAVFSAFLQQVVSMVGTLAADRIVLPPIMGIDRAAERLHAIKAATGLPVGELLGVQNSVPGYRLARALDRALSWVGVTVVEAETVAAVVMERQVQYVKLTGEKSDVVGARTFILATGKFLGGGLKKERTFYEAVFGLPVWVGGREVTRSDALDLTDPNPFVRQAIFSAGVRVDNSFRPLMANGRPRAVNLFAAGSVLQGYDYAADKCGAGVAIATGYAAANAALKLFEAAHA